MTADSKIATAAGKAPLHLLPLRWLVGLARVFEFGRKKHGRENYYASDNDPDECERYVAAVLRHLSAMQTPGGSYTPTSCATPDGESGIPHLDHALAGLVMLRARMCKSGALKADPGPAETVAAQAARTGIAYDLRKEPAESAACLTCGTPMLFYARSRGDGLCGPCTRRAPATEESGADTKERL